MTTPSPNGFRLRDESRQAFLRAWTERLYAEHGHILFLYGQKLSTPVIRIEPLTSAWGHWNPATRVITLAERLIENHPWDVVIEVLKHEMAHQLADEQLKARFNAAANVQGPHGALFRQACRLLGVPEWAAGATGELPQVIPDWRSRALTDDEERLLRRAEKLLALAQSSNEHEAALAVERVRQLYAKYNLERIAAGAPPGHVHCVIDGKRLRIPTEESAIFSILTAHFMVRAIFRQRYDARDLQKYRVVELLGTRENVLMAEYVYHFLVQKLESLWREYRSRTRCAGSARRSYMLGVLEGFRKKLEASDPRSAGTTPAESSAAKSALTSRALLRQADLQLQDFVAARFPRLSTRSWGVGQRDAESYGDGITDGSGITLRRGVAEGSGSRGLQLP